MEKTASVNIESDMPSAKRKMRAITTGMSTILMLRLVPERITTIKRGTSANRKCTSDDITTERGKIDLGIYSLFIRLRLLIKAKEETCVPWAKSCHIVMPDIT